MKKILTGLMAAAALGVSAGAAQAGNVHWSIGVNLPPIGTVISNGPVYHHPGAYYAPPPVYAPAPVYYAPPVVYRPAPRYYRPPVVVIDRRWDGRGYDRGHWGHRDGRGHYDGRGHRDGGWGPVPRDERRYRP